MQYHAIHADTQVTGKFITPSSPAAAFPPGFRGPMNCMIVHDVA